MKIFISHAARDRQLASRLAEELSREGLSVWNASQEIEPGANWAKEIGQALDESDVMIALITREGMKSESLQRDIQYGLTSKHFEQRLIPVLVGYTTFVVGKEVPWILIKMNPIYVETVTDCLEGRGFKSVVERVREIAQQESNASC